MARVGVCEDDAAVRRVLTEALRRHGHDPVVVRTGGEAVDRFGVPGAVDLVLLDVGLPDADGRDVCQVLRAHGLDVPVLFLTALDQVHDRVSGFRAGGDDYLVKPFAVVELLARVDALLRRSTTGQEVLGDLVLDPRTFGVRCGAEEQRLTPTEFRMLACFVAGRGEVVRRRVVVAAAWPDGAAVSENTVDSYVRRIRTKVAALGSTARLETVRGVGYVLR